MFFSDLLIYLHFYFFIRPFSLLVMKVDSLTSLGLSSLREISDGSVYISNNTHLCYQHTVKWQQIFTGSQIKRRRQLNDIKFNKLPSQCGKKKSDRVLLLFCMSIHVDSCEELSTTFRLYLMCVCRGWGPCLWSTVFDLRLLGPWTWAVSFLQESQSPPYLCGPL